MWPGGIEDYYLSAEFEIAQNRLAWQQTDVKNAIVAVDCDIKKSVYQEASLYLGSSNTCSGAIRVGLSSVSIAKNIESIVDSLVIIDVSLTQISWC